MSIVLPLIAALVVAAAVLTWLGHRWARWGATDDEVAAELPGDEWLAGGPPVRARMTRAVWIDAPGEEVWPWIAQMGRGAGWYSYDLLDNGRRRSAEHIVSWLPPPRPGDASPIGYLRQLEPGRVLAWWLPGGRFFGAYLRGVMTYRVEDHDGRARLVVRIQADARGPLARFACWFFRIVDGIMARRQLVGMKERVERFGSRSENPRRPETGARDQFQKAEAILASGERAGVPGTFDAARWRRAAIADGVVEDPAASRHHRS